MIARTRPNTGANTDSTLRFDHDEDIQFSFGIFELVFLSGWLS